MPGDQKIYAAYARSKTEFCVAVHRLDEEDMGSLIFTYNESNSQPWGGTYVPRNIFAVIDYAPPGQPPHYVAMSNEGDIYELMEDGVKISKIKGAGLDSPDATENLGYMGDMTQIGDSLYAVGQGWQLYKRAPGQDWERIEDESFKPEKGYDDSKFASINGSSEDAIFIFAGDSPGIVRSKEVDKINEARRAARDRGDEKEADRLFDKAWELEKQLKKKPQGRVLYFDGSEWDEMDVDGLRPGVIMATSPDEIWGGATGANFLYGDVENGIDNADVNEGDGYYYTTTKFKDRYIIGGSRNILSVKPDPDSMELDVLPVKPRMDKSYGLSVFKVQAVDDVMYYFDYNLGIYIWDGEDNWTHIPIPKEHLNPEIPGR